MEIWNQVNERLDRGFNTLAPFKRHSGTDGAYLLIETHFKNGYTAAERWSPSNREDAIFKNISDFMLSLGSKRYWIE